MMFLGSAFSVLILIPLFFQIQAEAGRGEFPALNTADVEYCNIKECGVIEPFGLEIRDVNIVEYKFDTEITFNFVNHNRLVGTREVWLRMRNPDGTLLEMAKGPIFLSDKVATITFTFTGFKNELETSSIYLGF